jgi:hypothetical protein
MKKKSPSKAGSVKRLLELLGTSTSEAPVNMDEARMLAEMEGGEVERHTGVRLNNECNKMCYPSEAQAKAGAKHRLRTSANVSRLRQYFCVTCKAWHLSSTFHKSN